MGDFADRLQLRAKQSGVGMALATFKIVSGLIFSLTIAIAAQEIIGFGNFSFFFVVVVFTSAFWRISKEWNFVPVFVFDLVCVLLAVCIHMYILWAPGA